MRLRHPRAVQGNTPPTAVSIDARNRVTVDDDGYLELPESEAHRFLSAWSDKYDVEREAMMTDSTDGYTRAELAEMKHPELKELYHELGGDPDAVNLTRSDDVAAGILEIQ